MAGKKEKEKLAKSLGTGGARKAAEAIIKRQSETERAGSETSRPSYSPKTSETIDMSNPGAYKNYQLEQAKKQLKKKKK